MIDRLIHFSVNNKFIIGLFTIALIAWGVYSFSQLPIDAVPDITNNQVQVVTQSPTLASQEVEQFITYPVELAMANIPDVVEIRSISRFGLSVVTIVFEDQVDVYLARQLVKEAIDEAREQIPDDLGIPAMAPVTTGLGEIYQYVLHPKPGYEKKYSAMDLRTMQDWIVKRQLAGIPGVAEVSSLGGYLKEYEVSIHPEKLIAMNTTISEIFEALENNNENTGGAYIEKAENAYFIRGLGLVTSLKDIEQIVVKNVNGIPVLIRNVAKVQYGHAIRYGAVTRNGEGEVVGGIVLMLKGENSLEVIERVKARVETIQKSLPEGVILEPFLDRSNLVERAISTVRTNLIEGGLIVIFILVLMLGNFRAGLVVASVIPLALLFAISMMNVFGVSGNLMSLGAIDFGLIVDGAVIIVEAIVHRIHTSQKLASTNRLTQGQMNDLVYDASTKIRKSAAFGEIIILIVYLPILTLVGIEGKMFKPMAETVGFAILGALILSLTYVPMMSALFLSKKVDHKRNISDKIMDWFQRKYDPMLNWALRKRMLLITTTVSLFLISLFIFSRMGGEFIPTLEEGDIATHQLLKPGSTLTQSIEVSGKIQKMLLTKFPEVKEVVTKIGSAEIPTDPMPIEAGDIIIVMKDKSEWESADTKEEMFEKMEAELSKIPGVTYEFTQPIQMRFNELMTGVRSDIAIKIYGEDLEVLAEKADEASKLINGIKGVADMKVEQVRGLPQIIVKYNRNKIAEYGLTIEEVNQTLRSSFAGGIAGVVYEGEKRFNLVVRLEDKHRKDLKDVRNLFITLHSGSQIPLYEVADVQFKEGAAQISRDDTKRRITVGINVRDRDVESLVEEIREKLDANLKLPSGYYVTYGGQFENLQAAEARLMIAVPVALVLILMLLFFTFHSISQALLIFTAIPMAAIGGVFALLLRGMPFSISAGVGFIALFGVAVLNGIVLIGYFNQLKKEGVTDLRERILTGTRVRLRPVLMTAAVASLGFLPMALSNSAGAEVQKPLATVVIGGLITSTLLTLLVIPVLYSYLEGRANRKNNGTSTAGLAGIILLGMFLPSIGKAQDTVSIKVTLNEAINLAVENHPKVKSARLEIERQQALTKTAIDLDKTDIELQRGQINDEAIDNNLSISQNFEFPTVYMQQKKVLNQQVELAERSLAVTQAEITRNVRSAYFSLVSIQMQLDLLVQRDSIYRSLARAAEIKYNYGETSYMEKLVTETKIREAEVLRQQKVADLKIAEQELKRWLNTDKQVIISDTIKRLMLPVSDSAFTQNAVINFYNQRIELAEAQAKLEKNKMLPDLSAGYFNQSISGVKGFQGFQAGISIPLWYRPQKGRIEAAKIEGKIAEAEMEIARNDLKAQLNRQMQEYHKLNTLINYYEGTGIKQSQEIIRMAQRAYKAGEMDYTDYMQITEQAFSIQTQYSDYLNQYNQAVINLNYILGGTTK